MPRSKPAPPDSSVDDASSTLGERAALQHSFARAIGHELRNRVNAARLTFSVVRLSDGERRDEALRALGESLEQLEEAVAFVSSISVAQARVASAPTRPVRLAELLADVRADLDELALQPTVEVRITAPVAEVAVEPVMLRLALINLVAGAVKRANRRKGERWVEIRGSAEAAHGECRLDVEDNGNGLPGLESAMGGDSTPAPLTRPEIGTLLAQEAIARLGGRLWVESNQPGLGTVVSFTFRSSDSLRQPSGNS